REVEPELVLDPLDQLGGRPLAEDRDRRIAGDEADQQEDDDADAEQDGHHREHPPCGVANHSVVAPVAPVSARSPVVSAGLAHERGRRPSPSHFFVTSSKLYFPCEFGEKPTTAWLVA